MPIRSPFWSPSGLALLLLGAIGLLPLRGEPARQFKPRPSHDDLLARQEQGPVVKGNNAKRLAADHAIPRLKLPDGLLENSTILAYRGSWTIVPKHAVLSVPAGYRKRVGAPSLGTLLPWREFFQRNRGWIHLQPVRMSDARGETVLSQEILEAHKTLGRVVVAVYKNGPISIRPPSSKPAVAPSSAPR